MHLILYHFASCPFCIKVRNAISQLGLDQQVELRDIREVSLYREELLALNNNIGQVPCLVIDGKPMLESEDIITFLSGIKS